MSVQNTTVALTQEALADDLIRKSAYKHTRYIVLLHGSDVGIAVVETEDTDGLFKTILDLTLLAGPDKTRIVTDRDVDTGNPSALAEKARSLGVSSDETLVVRGMDGHVNFIYRPDPIEIRLVDVVPPEPAKLSRMAEKVLTYAELPAVRLKHESIRFTDLAAQAPDASSYLIPCRASGLSLDRPTEFLDERPEKQDWTLLGCERSRQIHEHFYGEEPAFIEMCPRKLIADNGSPQLIKCCQLEEEIAVEGQLAVVPWGATLKQVENALVALVEAHERKE